LLIPPRQARWKSLANKIGGLQKGTLPDIRVVGTIPQQWELSFVTNLVLPDYHQMI
jgi:hypothetical protein